MTARRYLLCLAAVTAAPVAATALVLARPCLASALTASALTLLAATLGAVAAWQLLTSEGRAWRQELVPKSKDSGKELRIYGTIPSGLLVLARVEALDEEDAAYFSGYGRLEVAIEEVSPQGTGPTQTVSGNPSAS